MDWNEVYGDVRRVAGRTAKRLGETADMAALKVKLAAAEGRLEEAYTLLGRTAYLHFTGEEDHAKKVALAIEAVDRAKGEVRDIKLKIAIKREEA